MALFPRARGHGPVKGTCHADVTDKPPFVGLSAHYQLSYGLKWPRWLAVGLMKTPLSRAGGVPFSGRVMPHAAYEGPQLM